MSSEALERRESIHKLCVAWLSVPSLPDNAIPASPDDVLWLLAEVARLEQAVSDVTRERAVAGLRLHRAEAALAVAREREQRAVEALREAEFSQCGWAGGCPVCAETPDEWAPNRGHRRNCKLGAALVDEPAAATLAEPDQGTGPGGSAQPSRRQSGANIPSGSASAAADEPPRPFHEYLDAQDLAVMEIDAAADEPGETPT